MMIKDGTGHHPHSLRDPTPIADSSCGSLEPHTPAELRWREVSPVLLLQVANSYTEFPKEGTYVHMSGSVVLGDVRPIRFQTRSATGTTNVVVPRKVCTGGALGFSGRTW